MHLGTQLFWEAIKIPGRIFVRIFGMNVMCIIQY